MKLKVNYNLRPQDTESDLIQQFLYTSLFLAEGEENRPLSKKNHYFTEH
jgi:hypothetical protein